MPRTARSNPRSSRRFAALVAIVTVVACGCAADWTQRLGDNTHASHTPDTGLSADNVGTLREQWRYRPGPCNGVTTGAQWFATPVTFKGVVYIGDDYGCLHAIDEQTGAVRWTRPNTFVTGTTCGQPLGIVSSVNVQDDGAGNPVLYFHAPDGYLYKLRGSDGATIWRSVVMIPSSIINDVYAWSSPTVAGNKVIVGISSNCDVPFVQGKVLAYDTATGRRSGPTRPSRTAMRARATGTTPPWTRPATCTCRPVPPTTTSPPRTRTPRPASSSTRS